ncbi:4-hydroxythreonine-4-phosphate dehydrogenase PdxA [Halieaceae bacterium IMCC14734]|uniref:4-hydroxythreonine-4-phosphate dehydrogenase n=1 Tax=Candidatus Litorirhabdus singularis TaxID=2518993 RepID=A0ABT3TNM3_9GAMM|nr:4-hydroxythreonine-4-phosphate dehydrogenase PdxA [Candidatus Litorirhabdus singularis]MCX2983360.1 4-hydroxythreonine-4-phosphate dehydrogenase PdxA [Candidatus Litorirhabdus singularis]
MIARLALTTGEPAGIGPDLALLLSRTAQNDHIVAIGDRSLLQQRAAQLGITVTLQEFDPAAPHTASVAGSLQVLHVPLAAPCVAGQLNSANANYVLQTLQSAVTGIELGHFDAMVTAPVQKSVINAAGIPFSGHTEYLAELTATPKVVMMLATEGLRVALVTTHLPLKAVPAAITAAELTSVCEILHRDLQTRFGLPNPVIAVLGLNPHAGEDGHLGTEEQTIIEPALNELRAGGMDVRGPLPADTAFNPKVLKTCDAVLAMYHDQGLPVLKYAGFGNAVNITLGLPIVRTSVDHGTALDLAGSGQIDSGSLHYALSVASEMVTAGAVT